MSLLGRRGSSAPVRTTTPVRARRGTSFVTDIVSELRKVTWPTREEAIRLTAIVIVVSLVLGIVLGGVDYIFYWVINSLLLGKT